MPQLDFAHYQFVSQLFWLAISFALLYLYSAKVILPRISKILEVRDSTIKNALAEAEAAKAISEEFVRDYEAIINEAKHEALQIIEDARMRAELTLKDEVVELEEMLAEKIKQAKSEMENFKLANASVIEEISQQVFAELIKNLK